MARYEYMALLAACVVVTAPLEVGLRLGVYRQWRRLFAALSCMGSVFVGWDLVGARLGHWGYNAAFVTGLRLFDLPLEEYLFFAVVPLCAILTYEAVCKTLPDVSRWVSARLGRGQRAGR
jgi:lycopene cyclase domain-containing protein